MIQWQVLTFEQLSTQQLYQLIKLRIDVFVVEQNCPYHELDDHDHHSEVRHLLGYQNDRLAAYARLLPAGITYPQVSIGRVITDASFRGNGSGHQLLTKAIEQCEQLWPKCTIEIGAQEHLIGFYGRHGFMPFSSVYLEDGIPHVDMRRVPNEPD